MESKKKNFGEVIEPFANLEFEVLEIEKSWRKAVQPVCEPRKNSDGFQFIFMKEKSISVY